MSRTLLLVAFVLIGGSLLGCAATPTRNSQHSGQATQEDSARVQAANELTAQDAANFSLYAMASANSYHKTDRPRFPLEVLGWQQIDRKGEPTSNPSYHCWLTGLAYDIYKKDSANKYLFVYRGTDSKIDYLQANLPFGISIQYKSANKKFRQFLAAIPEGSEVDIVGHSLGGGLALSASVRYGRRAVVLDTSPRVFDGLGDRHMEAQRIAIYQNTEVLEKIRRLWDKYSDVVSIDDTYITRFDFGDVSPHSSYELARQMLILGATVDPDLKKIQDQMPSK